MTQLRDDCFAFGDSLMPMAEALDILSARLAPIAERERVPLKQGLGRILAADLISSINVPAHDNSAVDGYAVRHADLNASGPTELRVVGRAAAGHPSAEPVSTGTAVRIFTGGIMPDGGDCVVMQEDAERLGETIRVPPGLKAGANRRLAGEDTRIGDTVLAKGHRLRPQDIGLAASVGIDELPVFRPLRVAVFSSGDELLEPGQPLRQGAVFDSNRYIIHALLSGLGCDVSDVAILPDRFEAVRDGLAKAAETHDLLITSGGMSTGDEDHIKAAVEALGSLHFWRLAIKPGRPVALGQVRGKAFIGLPGNPVAAMVCFLRFARRIILELGGRDASLTTPNFFALPAGFEMDKKPARREWIRARLSRNDSGAQVVERYAKQGSGVLRSMVESDGLIEVPEDVTRIDRGDLVQFLPFSEVMG